MPVKVMRKRLILISILIFGATLYSIAQLDRKKVLSTYQSIGEKFLSDSLHLSDPSKSKDSKRMAAATYQRLVAELKFKLSEFEEDLKGWETDAEILDELERKIKSDFVFPPKYYEECRKKVKEPK